MTSQEASAFRIAIAGGGIAGLTLALVLKKFKNDKNIVIDLYEARHKFSESGAGITAWLRTRSIFDTLGLGENFEKRTASPRMMFRKGNNQDPFFFYEFEVPHGSATLSRQDMLDILVDDLSPELLPYLHIHLCKKLVSYEQDADAVVMHFEDGSSAQADILIGADGLASPTRKEMYTKMSEDMRGIDPERADILKKHCLPSWIGTHAYRALLNHRRIEKINPNNIFLNQLIVGFGVRQHIISYPISPEVINILFFDTSPNSIDKPLQGPSMVPSSKEEIMALYKDWEGDAREVIETIDDTSRWAMSHVRALPTYVDCRVALVGDSAHAMATHLGAGAGQAVEDAYILGHILADPIVNKDNVIQALNVYDTIRRPIAHDVVEESLRLGGVYELDPTAMREDMDSAKLEAGDREELQKLVSVFRDITTVHFTGMPENDWYQARAMLYGRLHKQNGHL
ncbi:hypothetical protein QCA50_014514 [Cerrena zonata]|uniref:FAD-binding domain-containing protein n=1 Tax=Cerrena zonata TaxID=2478898 RepID=A0AAW0FNP5_9APHY